MDPNFPHNLSIQASRPSSALRYLTSKDSPTGEGDPFSDNEGVILSQDSDIQSYGIAGRIWEAAYAMILYMNPSTNLEFDPMCSLSHYHEGAVVELGAGTGFLGFKIARIISLAREHARDKPKSLILTDMETVCPLLERNRFREIPLATDPPGVNLVVQALEWGNWEHGLRLATRLTGPHTDIAPSPHGGLLSHIVCSDLVYFPELFAPLLHSLLQLSSPPFSTVTQPVQVIISCTLPGIQSMDINMLMICLWKQDMIRSLTKELPFWSAFGTWFDFSPVLMRRKTASPKHWGRFGDHEDGTMFIFVATRKLESLAWTVPDNLELMRRGNDTFETLLLMNILHEE